MIPMLFHQLDQRPALAVDNAFRNTSCSGAIENKTRMIEGSLFECKCVFALDCIIICNHFAAWPRDYAYLCIWTWSIKDDC